MKREQSIIPARGYEKDKKMVVGDVIKPPTQGFSVAFNNSFVVSKNLLTYAIYL